MTDPAKPTPRGLFMVGGTIKSLLSDSDTQVVQDHLASLLQVHNLVILIGSGASFHLGSPSTRNLTNDAVERLIKDAGEDLDGDADLLKALNPGDNGDLERLLNGLQLAVSMAEQASRKTVTFGEGKDAKAFAVDTIDGLRQKINRALAVACHLPNSDVHSDFKDDPFRAHRDFFSRVVRSRRANLPRAKVFTTNYDLVIEQSLDQLGYPYVDGFSGTVDRHLNLAFYGLDYYRVDTSTQQVIARADSALYLHKVHGSLNWRTRSNPDPATGISSWDVVQVAPDTSASKDLVLIYPTTAKEGDTLSYPYSDLLRLLGDAVQQEDTAVITIGYGFADAHINRLMLRSLATNQALSIFVADPVAVGDSATINALLTSPDDIKGTSLSDALALVKKSAKDTPIAQMALAKDARIAVLTGNPASFAELADLLPDTAPGSWSPSDASRLIDALEAMTKPPAPPAPSAPSKGA